MVDLVNIHRVPNPEKEESLPTALPKVFYFQILDVVRLLTSSLLMRPHRSGRTEFNFVFSWEE